MLVDQYYVRRASPVTFFGRRTTANPLIARLARHFDCPIHGIRVVRLPGDRFQLRADRGDRRRRATPRARSTSQAPCRSSPTWSKAGSASIPSNGCGCTAAGGDD